MGAGQLALGRTAQPFDVEHEVTPGQVVGRMSPESEVLAGAEVRSRQDALTYLPRRRSPAGPSRPDYASGQTPPPP